MAAPPTPPSPTTKPSPPPKTKDEAAATRDDKLYLLRPLFGGYVKNFGPFGTCASGVSSHGSPSGFSPLARCRVCHPCPNPDDIFKEGGARSLKRAKRAPLKIRPPPPTGKRVITREDCHLGPNKKVAEVDTSDNFIEDGEKPNIFSSYTPALGTQPCSRHAYTFKSIMGGSPLPACQECSPCPGSLGNFRGGMAVGRTITYPYHVPAMGVPGRHPLGSQRMEEEESLLFNTSVCHPIRHPLRWECDSPKTKRKPCVDCPPCP